MYKPAPGMDISDAEDEGCLALVIGTNEQSGELVDWLPATAEIAHTSASFDIQAT